MKDISERFKIRDESEDTFGYMLGLKFELINQRQSMQITQTPAIETLAERFGIANNDRTLSFKKYMKPMEYGTKIIPCKEGEEVPPEQFDYRGIVGSLLYIAQATRPDISFAVTALSRHVNRPSKHHTECAIHVLRYLLVTKNIGITYHKSEEKDSIQLQSFETQSTANPEHRSKKFAHDEYEKNLQSNYCDADYGGSFDGRSTSGCIILLAGAGIRWFSRTQPTVALSTAANLTVSPSTAASSTVCRLTALVS